MIVFLAWIYYRLLFVRYVLLLVLARTWLHDWIATLHLQAGHGARMGLYWWV